MGLGFVYAWLQYEKNEDRHLKDKAYIDTHGMLIGMALGGIVWRIWL